MSIKKFATQMEIETKSDKVPINSRFIRVYVIAFGAYLHLCGDFFTDIFCSKSHNFHKKEMKKAIATTIRAIFYVLCQIYCNLIA